eukprot:scaffold570465_cov34-Prasinocladus_malaysianus.AAC.1
MMCTPDRTSMLGRFMGKPTENNWKAAKRVLRYIKGTLDIDLNYKRPDDDTSTNIITAYADASFASEYARRHVRQRRSRPHERSEYLALVLDSEGDSFVYCGG